MWRTRRRGPRTALRTTDSGFDCKALILIDPNIATCPPFPTPVITSQYLPDPVLFGAVDDIEEYIESDDKLIVIPGEDYSQHDSVRIVSLPNGSSEPCCGTHLSHLSDIQAGVTYHTLILLGF